MRIVLMAIALSLPLASFGDDTSAPAEETAALDEPAALDELATPDKPAALGVPVSQDTLAGQRGGDDQVTNIIRVTGEVTDNVAENVVTGANNIQDGSFANASGVVSVVQNTGANVLIQTATIVNVQFANP